MAACPSPSSSGVHDLFRDMYRQPSQPGHAYSSHPPPMTAAPSALSPSPSLTKPTYSYQGGATDRTIPIQVNHTTPHMVYNAEYANGGQEDKSYIAQVQEDQRVPVNHLTSVGGASPGPPPPSYSTLDRDAYRLPSSPSSHIPGSVRNSSQPSTPIKTPQSPMISPASRIAASVADFARRSSYPYAYPPSQSTTSQNVQANNRHPPYPSHQQASSTPTKPRSNQAYRPHLPQPLHPSYGSDNTQSLPDGVSGSEDLSFPTPPPEASMPAFTDPNAADPGTPTTPGVLPPPPPPPLLSPQNPQNNSPASKPSQDPKVGLHSYKSPSESSQQF